MCAVGSLDAIQYASLRKGHSKHVFVDDLVSAIMSYEDSRDHYSRWRVLVLRIQGGALVGVERRLSRPGDTRSRRLRTEFDRALSAALGGLLAHLMRIQRAHLDTDRVSGRDFVRQDLPEILNAAGIATPRYGGGRKRRRPWSVAAVERAVKRARAEQRRELRRMLEEDDRRWRDLRRFDSRPGMRAELDRHYLLPDEPSAREQALENLSEPH